MDCGCAANGDLSFHGVTPLSGFTPFATDDRAQMCPRQVISPQHFEFGAPGDWPSDPDEAGHHNDGHPHLWASGLSRVRREGSERYLQLQLSFPAAYGELLVFEGPHIVDRAELAKGWQHSAVDLAHATPGAELTLEFRDGAGERVERVALRAIFLTASWGRGQRKRLKCSMPFDRANILQNGDVSMCMCPEWLTAGNVLGNNRDARIKDIWNDAPYQRVRRMFLEDRIEEVCRKEVCLILSGDLAPIEPTPEVIASINDGAVVLDHGITFLHHDIDKGCNLDCIMCRDQKILPDPETVDRGMRDVQDVLDMNSQRQMIWSGAGEVFAMKKAVKMMESDTFSSNGVSLGFNTNLTYFNEKLWRKIRHNSISFLSVSADGCSPQVYNSIRLGADWDTVERNMRFVSSLRRNGELRRLIWNYTTLRQNVQDVARAVALAEELGFDNLRFIAQFGELSRTGGNMFEECDMQALDALHDQLEQAKAFDKSWIWLSETGMRERRYRTPGFRIDFAQHVDERPGYATADATDLATYNRRRSTKILRELKADMDAGLTPPAALSEINVAFLKGFVADAPQPVETFHRLRLSPRREVLSEVMQAHGLARWARKLAATNDPSPRRRPLLVGRDRASDGAS